MFFYDYLQLLQNKKCKLLIFNKLNLVKKISAEETYSIRKEVLRKGIDKPFRFDGDFDENTFHLGVFQQENLVGIATFMQRNSKLLKGSQYQLRGMATLPSVRGLGFASLLLDNACKELKNKNIDFLWCNAREVAVKFYQKNEFQIISKPFEVSQIGTHYIMCKKL